MYQTCKSFVIPPISTESHILFAINLVASLGRNKVVCPHHHLKEMNPDTFEQQQAAIK